MTGNHGNHGDTKEAVSFPYFSLLVLSRERGNDP